VGWCREELRMFGEGKGDIRWPIVCRVVLILVEIVEESILDIFLRTPSVKLCDARYGS
jgi:hypothetical protein